MPKIATCTIARPKGLPCIARTEHNEFASHQRRVAQARRKADVATLRSDSPTQCSKCPATRSCKTCATINAERIEAGLLVPKGDHTPHRWACLIPVTHGKVGGGLNGKARRKVYPTITACVRKLGGGWRVGVASLDGIDVFVGRPTRNQQHAWAHAQVSAADLREGLNYAERGA